jgi:hypothetical protein
MRETVESSLAGARSTLCPEKYQWMATVGARETPARHVGGRRAIGGIYTENRTDLFMRT